MKKLVDTSLVAWGYSTASLDVSGGDASLDHKDANYHLLANSPHAFSVSSAVSFSAPRSAIAAYKRSVSHCLLSHYVQLLSVQHLVGRF